MRKIISAVLALSLSTVMLVSCGVYGASVPYYTLTMDNYSENIFEKYDAVEETITYYENGKETYAYSIYMEKALESAYLYNICETFDGYAFYGHEGELYSVTNGKTYAVIQADKSSYFEYIKDYEDRMHVLDQGEKYQIYSKELEDNVTEVSYYTKMTPIISEDLYKYGVTETDQIISTYTLDQDNFYLTIKYSVKHKDGTEDKIAERKFEYFEAKPRDIFEKLFGFSEMVNVTIVSYAGTVNETHDVYTVPKGVYIGLDSGEKNISFYMDEAYEIEFDFETALANGDITIYAKNN